MMAERLPAGKKVIYALGQLGWSLASYGVANLINYFYLPSETAGGANFPPFVFTGAILGIVTIIGLVNAGGRVFDAITDPLIAGASDRSRSRLGKRRVFMAIGAAPFAILSVLVFVPPTSGESVANAVWLAVLVPLFYLFMTIYVVPYTALISEFGHDSNERLGISTALSITWALGFAIGNQVYAVRDALRATLGPVVSFQVTLAVFGGVSLILMLLPVLFIDERRYSENRVSKEGSFAALASAFRNRDFRVFTFSDFMYWLALTFIQTGISYYVTLLIGLPESFASLLMTVLFLLSFAFYVPINLIAKRTGKKRLLSIAFVVMSIGFVVVFLLGRLPLPGGVQGYMLVVLMAFPLAVFGILPNAIIADVAEADGIETGNYKAGVFFGARNLMMKLGISVANLVFPSFLLLGRTTANPLGVRLTAVAAFVFCIAGLGLFLLYNERRVRGVLSKHEGSNQATAP